MLASVNRLRHRRDIDRVYKRGTYGAGEGLVSIKAAPGQSRLSRAVVVVAKKVDKRAVVRNRLRRRYLGVLHELWETVPDGYDIVVSVHRDVSTAPIRDLNQAVTKALNRARVTQP